MDFLTLIQAIAAVGYAAVLARALWQQRSQPQRALLLALYAALALVWVLVDLNQRNGWMGYLVQPLAQRIQYYGLLALALVFLFLSRAFLQMKGRSGAILFSSLVLGAAGLVLDVNLPRLPDTIALTGGVSLLRSGTASLSLGLAWAVLTFGAAFLVWNAAQDHNLYFTRDASGYWALVLVISAAGGLLIWLGQVVAGTLLHFLGTLMAAWVVLRPQLPEFSYTLRRLASRVINTTLALLLYGLALVLVQTLLQRLPGVPPLASGLVLALGIVFVFNPAWQMLKERIDRGIIGIRREPTQVLRQYSQSITNILDLQLLATVAIGTASEVFEVRRGFLFLVDYEKNVGGRNVFRLHGTKGMGEAEPAPGLVAEDSPLVVFWRRERKPLTLAEINTHPRFREIERDEQLWLAHLGLEIFVPIFSKNEWIGMLALGTKGSGAPYMDGDRLLLSTLADQTAVALENTRLVDGLMRLNTDFRRAYTALEQANRHLERLDRAKSDFISIASHELRTPLTVISGTSQMMQDDPELQKNPFYKQMLGKIHTGTQRLHEIVESMLDMAKVDTRDLQLDPQPISLHTLMRAVNNDLRKAAEERKLSIDLQDLDKLPPVRADLAALRKVFYHLLINAIKYTPDGGKITVSGRLTQVKQTSLASLSNPGQEPGKDAVEVIVSDSGIGIDARFHELIFTKFYQTGELGLHSTGKTKFKGSGSGLGLAIVRGIVDAHGGRVWVESAGYDEESLPGSQFHVVLPIKGPRRERAMPTLDEMEQEDAATSASWTAK